MIELTIGIDLRDVWSHYCTLNHQGEVVGRGHFRTSPRRVEKWFTDDCQSLRFSARRMNARHCLRSMFFGVEAD
jgi:hypothetical protein